MCVYSVGSRKLLRALQLVIRVCLTGGIPDLLSSGESAGELGREALLLPLEDGFFIRRLGLDGQVSSTCGYNAFSGHMAICLTSFDLCRFNPFSSRKHALTNHSIRTGPSGVTGLMGSLLVTAWPEEAESELLRAHWIIGPPFVDLKSPATMRNTKGISGWQTLLQTLVPKTLSPIKPLTHFPVGIVRALETCHFSYISMALGNQG